MPARLSFLPLVALLLAAPAAYANDSLDSAAGPVRVIGENPSRSLTVDGKTVTTEEYAYINLVEKIGNLILVSLSQGGNACAATFAWLDTSPGAVTMTNPFGTCSDYVEVTHDSETVTVTMPSMDGSVGKVAYVYDGEIVEERQLGLETSEIAQAAEGNPDAWIGESPHEYLTAAELEASLIKTIGWDALDELRNTLVIGDQEMKQDGNWIVGNGCRPHACNTDFAAIALHRESGRFIAAIKREGAKPRLLGEPEEALPVAVRKVMTAN